MPARKAPAASPAAPPLIYAFALACGCTMAWVDGSVAPTSLDAWNLLAGELMAEKHPTLRGTGITMTRCDDEAQAITCIGAVKTDRPCIHNRPDKIAAAAEVATAKTWNVDEVRTLYLRNPLVIGGIRTVA